SHRPRGAVRPRGRTRAGRQEGGVGARHGAGVARAAPPRRSGADGWGGGGRRGGGGPDDRGGGREGQAAPRQEGGRRAGETAAQRTWIGCRQKRPKGTLVRLVRGADGRVHVDEKGQAPGRGAYVCPEPDCLGRALNRARLGHAFKRPSEPPVSGAAIVLNGL